MISITRPLALAATLALTLGNAPAATTKTVAAKIPGYQVTVDLTPRAAAKLAATKETIVVSASYFGEGNAKGKRFSDNGGEVGWATEKQVELKAAGTATFAAPKPIPGRLAMVKVPLLLINVFSGRHASGDNILDCGIFQDSIFVAAKTPIKIRCDLLG